MEAAQEPRLLFPKLKPFYGCTYQDRDGYRVVLQKHDWSNVEAPVGAS